MKLASIDTLDLKAPLGAYASVTTACDLLAQVGCVVGVIATTGGTVVAGLQEVREAKRRGIASVPAVRVGSPAEAIAFLASVFSEWVRAGCPRTWK